VGEQPVRILEVSFGEFDEDDIIRLEDIYGRIGP
jgi:mannose-6-phosphate isomerase